MRKFDINNTSKYYTYLRHDFFERTFRRLCPKEIEKNLKLIFIRKKSQLFIIVQNNNITLLSFFLDGHSMKKMKSSVMLNVLSFKTIPAFIETLPPQFQKIFPTHKEFSSFLKDIYSETISLGAKNHYKNNYKLTRLSEKRQRALNIERRNFIKRSRKKLKQCGRIKNG